MFADNFASLFWGNAFLQREKFSVILFD